jgi:methyl acetate hydrolase
MNHITGTTMFGRSAGSISWACLLNRYFWLDPVKHVTGALFS